MGAVVAHPEMVDTEFVFLSQDAEFGKGFLLSRGRGQIERLVKADLGGNSLLDQLPERGRSHGLEHLTDSIMMRPEMPAAEAPPLQNGIKIKKHTFLCAAHQEIWAV